MLALLLLPQAAQAQGPGTGGITFTTSAINHTTVNNVTVDQRTSTGVIQNILNGGDQVRLQWSLHQPLHNPKVQAALNVALKVLNSQKPPFPQGVALRFVSRAPGIGGTSSTSTLTSPASTVVTTTTTIGPGTILIGDNQATPFFVAAGNTNIDILTHNEFVQTTTTTLSGGAPTVETLQQQRIILLDLGAVYSTLFSGLPVALAQRESLVNAHAGGIGDVNGRIFRAWLGLNDSEPPQGDGSLSDDMRVFTSGNVGWLSQNGGDTAAGLRDTREAASVGAEWKINPVLRFGFAATYIHSDTEFSADLGKQHIDGGALSVYATWRSDTGSDGFKPSSKNPDGRMPSLHGSFFADLLYSAGLFNDTNHRNTLTGSTANSSADDWSHLVSLNTGYIFQVSDTMATGPYASLTYIHGHLDGSTEHGGGTAALSYGAQSYDSLVSAVGWQANWKLRQSWGTITPLIHLGWERENFNDAGDVNATLLQSPFSLLGVGRFGSFGVTTKRESARYDALTVGAGVSFDIAERWTLNLSANELTDFGPRNDFSLGLRAEYKF